MPPRGRMKTPIEESNDALLGQKKAASAYDRWSFLFLRGFSSFCFIPACLNAVYVIKNDTFARYSMHFILVASLAWNNLAFAIPQASAKPGVWQSPRALVVSASTLDGFGVIAGSLGGINYFLGLGLKPWQPWVIAAVYSAFEHWYMLGNAKADGFFTGVNGTRVRKINYPVFAQLSRGVVLASSALLSARCTAQAQKPAEVAALLVGLSVALWTYTTNGYDRDFTCARVWLWHSAVGVFSYLQITEEGRKGA